jgi:transposase InsO family protein
MHQAGIQGAKRRGKAWRTTKPDPLAHRRPDLVERDFSAEAPNRLWVADLSYLRSWEGSLFFAFVIDAFSRKIVGWQLAPHMRTDLVLDALRMALAQREGGADVELVHHSDRGSQYTSIDYTQTLEDNGVLASVGSVGDAYDNAMAESFVDSFKTELIAERSWRSRTQLELAVVEYIAWFNNDRLHESLGDVSPAEFESLYVAPGSIELPTEKIGNHQSRPPWNLVRLNRLESVRHVAPFVAPEGLTMKPPQRKHRRGQPLRASALAPLPVPACNLGAPRPARTQSPGVEQH